VETASWAGTDAREILASVACRGSGDIDTSSKEFERNVAVLRECFRKVSFRSKAKGTDAEIIAATACIGVTDAEETATCMDKVERKFRHAEDAAAEPLAAMACARGNPALETAACVDHVGFRLSASGIMADRLAAIACGR